MGTGVDVGGSVGVGDAMLISEVHDAAAIRTKKSSVAMNVSKTALFITIRPDSPL